jgi:uncharacterized membrane protein YidH (DUF202 family)
LAVTGDRIGRLASWLEVFYSFWAAFGWGNIKFPGWVYTVLGLLTLTAVAGLALAAWRWTRRDNKTDRQSLLTALLALAVLALAGALEIWMGQVRAPHGRLLYPAMAAVAVLLMAGWRSLHRWLPVVGIGLVGTLAILSPLILIRPAYAPPAALTDGEMNEMLGSEILGWRFGRVAELLGVKVKADSAAAGELLPVRLCWRVLGPTEVDYTVLVHLVGPEESVVASRHTYPGLGSYPSTVWEAGRLFCDLVRIDIPLSLTQTLLYRVEVGLLDANTGARLPVTDPGDVSLSHTFVDAVRLETIRPEILTEPPAGEQTIRLVAADFADAWQAGEGNGVTLRWWPAGIVDGNYTVFLHLRRPSGGGNVAQGDGPPLEGWYPTSAWIPGQVVVDPHTILVPPELPAGPYDLVVGWYDPESGARLGDEIPLGSVEVRR